MRQLILDIRPDAPADFDNYLPGPNVEACATVRAHATGLDGEPLLYLWGETGTGKSHLLAAWARSVGAVLAPPMPEPPVSWLAVDDAHRLDGDAQIRLFSLINAAREGSGRILVCGPTPPGQLGLRPDLATRLAQGLVFRLSPLSEADKIAALRVRAEAHGLRLTDEVTHHLLTHCRRDLPHLLGMVDALDAYSLSRKRPVSLPLLKELLRQREA
ncbi:MAG: DnaA regulatory inactivator Hda [Betaproteobacteria bacterium]|nr:DnaA regulatory inactivator Hda [Betaproteobacteria bacterium]